MCVWILFFVHVIGTNSQELNTFGIGLSSQWLYPTEVIIQNEYMSKKEIY